MKRPRPQAEGSAVISSGIGKEELFLPIITGRKKLRDWLSREKRGRLN